MKEAKENRLKLNKSEQDIKSLSTELKAARKKRKTFKFMFLTDFLKMLIRD